MYKVNPRCSLLLFSLALFLGCSSNPTESHINRYDDSTYVRIGDFQDRRLADSLIVFLRHSNHSYRQQALIALGSVQDSTVVDEIGSLLSDSNDSIRMAAAFALGQIRSKSSAALLREALDTEKDPRLVARLFESYGRATSKWDLWEIPKDTVAAAGFAWGLFRTSGDSLLNPLAAKLLSSPSTTVRLGAAFYFARKAPKPNPAGAALITLARSDKNEVVRMAATLALKKINTEKVFQTLRELITKDQSYRVRVNAAASLLTFSTSARPILVTALKDQNVNVAVKAAEVISSLNADYSTWQETVTLARAATNYRVKALLYQYAVICNEKDQNLYKEIRSLYSIAADPYAKAALLAAMGKTLMSFSFVLDELKKADTAVVRTAAALALVDLNYNKLFLPSLNPDFANAYRDAILLKDVAVTSVICGTLSDPELNYKSVVKDWSFLYDVKKSLKLPEDNETLQSVERAIAYFEDKEFTPPRNDFNHPINWQLVRSIKQDQLAVIATTKGVITIQLFVNEAPGSVANFIQLVKDKDYNDKFFHRVVPNFVAQGGCPRGDGFGSENYSIRSEFSLRRYKTGSVGLASSGKDTESVQWFITHSPTPHLDGAYTIFAEVVDGMDIVHQLEVGDKILNIELPQ
ncbi:peptidylprolyl isomerase [Chryseolinea sp. T2]|uniref:peptidylprolyl isomerase n=1 Tax=Chryseolinea sp. T2 TaxID=3129255 RepID=UPI003078914F